MSTLNASTVHDISAFLDDHIGVSAETGIATGIICTGPDAASQGSIFEQLSDVPCAGSKRIYIPLNASECSNLKAVLKAIIQKATAQNTAVDDEDPDQIGSSAGSKLLNYDLQILSDYVRDRRVEQVVIAIRDTEAFESLLLSELIELLGSWQDRIPFALLLSIATSLYSLQQRLSKNAVKWFRGRTFDLAPTGDEVEQVFEAITHPETPLWIGPGLMRFAVERQSDYVQSIDSFVEAVKYAYMSCYYANALTIFLDPTLKCEDVPKDHFKAVRNLESFQNHCRELLKTDQTRRVAEFLYDEEVLFAEVTKRVHDGKRALADMNVAVSVLRALQATLPSQQSASKSSLYVQGMSNKLKDSSSLRSLLLSIRQSPSNVAEELLDAILETTIPNDMKTRCRLVRAELDDLILNQNRSYGPLRSEDDVKNSTLRTTVIAQKVELSKQKSSLSKQDAAYTAILRRFTDLLEEYFARTLVDPTKLVFHEIFLYDLKSPHRDVFTPRPRHAVERALAAPHDYLACECCAPTEGDGDESTLSACQPATAILYQLYLESGSLINVSDLFQAFQAVMGDERDVEQNVALFQRALAELRYLGLVKNTRKRIDHIAKVAWRGL